MSVTAFPPSASKRLFEEAGSEGGSPACHTSKRARLLHSSPSLGRCGNPHQGDSFSAAYASSSAAAAILGLLSLFPEMEEQAVISVLSDCGDNIDAAIKRLSELRLTSSRMAQDATAAAAAAAAAAPGPSGARRQQQDPAAQQQQPEPSTSASTPTPSHVAQCVELLVQEMSAAKDVADARARATRLLTLFSKHLAEQGPSGLMDKLQELQKENHILKRAVQIQNTKLQERAQQEQEIQQLRAMLGQYQEQVRTLELSNYSLALHLQKATSDAAVSRGHHPPDVC